MNKICSKQNTILRCLNQCFHSEFVVLAFNSDPSAVFQEVLVVFFVWDVFRYLIFILIALSLLYLLVIS